MLSGLFNPTPRTSSSPPTPKQVQTAAGTISNVLAPVVNGVLHRCVTWIYLRIYLLLHRDQQHGNKYPQFRFSKSYRVEKILIVKVYLLTTSKSTFVHDYMFFYHPVYSSIIFLLSQSFYLNNKNIEFLKNAPMHHVIYKLVKEVFK